MQLVELPILIQDLLVTGRLGLPPAEGFKAEAEIFNDGPRCARLEVSDPLAKYTARYQPPGKRQKMGHFTDHTGEDILKRLRQLIRSGISKEINDLVELDEFIQASVFAGILKTLALFEHKEIMGRTIHWAMPGALKVYPRRGELSKPNSFYQRGVGLSFYSSRGANPPGEIIYPSLSRDALAHESAHAILDGIEPALYDAIGPHPRALHEALSDLVAVLLAFKSRTLSVYVLKQSVGSLLDVTEFSGLADQIGAQKAENLARLLRNSPTPLRSLVNNAHLDPSRPEGFAPPDQPYAISLALSGALYHVLQQHHERLKQTLARTEPYRSKPQPLFSASGQAMMDAARCLRSVLFRALDFLPPGEISFADYADALLAVHQAFSPQDDFYRRWISDEMVRRGIVTDPADLGAGAWLPADPPRFPDGTGIAQLVDDEEAAQRFIELNRAWLGMPEPVFQQRRFSLRPRLLATPEDMPAYRIFKVSWEYQEPNPLPGSYPQERWVRLGTTLILDDRDGHLLARLSCAAPTPGLYPSAAQLQRRQKIFAARQADTTRYLARLAATGQLQPQSLAPHASPGAGLADNEAASLRLAQIAVLFSEDAGVMCAAGAGSGLHEWA